MEIRQYGQNSCWIKGKKEVVWLNPDKKMIEGKGKEDRIVLFWSINDNFFGLETGNKVVIYGPGEYEVGGVEINGMKIGEDGLAYLLSIDGIKIGWINQAGAELTDKKKEKLAEADVLIVEGGEVKDAFSKAKLLAVSYLIMTNVSGEDQKKLLDLADCEGKEKQESLKVEKESMPESTEVVLLTEM